MQKSTQHWPSIIILIIVISGACLFLLAAIGFGTVSIISLVSGEYGGAGSMIFSLGAGFQGLLLAGAAWIVFQKTSGQPKADEPLQFPFARWQIPAALVAALVALAVGGAISFLEVELLSWFILPLLTILLIVPPIWILLGLGTNQLDFGPRWRAFGIFGIGMTLGPLIMISLEIILVLFLIILAAVIIAGQPGAADEIIRLASLLENETDPEKIMTLLGPYVFHPAVIGAALAYISLAVPIIEELLKPLGIWLFMRKIETPVQGFTLGLLSGAAYALFESLGASAQGGQAWAAVVVARAGTSLLHILSTGLMGWAIISAVRERRYFRLLGTYVVLILLHGIWNASAVATSFAGASDVFMDTSWSISVIPAAACGIVVLGIGMLILLIASNRKIRQLSGPILVLDPESGELSSASGQGVK